MTSEVGHLYGPFFRRLGVFFFPSFMIARSFYQVNGLVTCGAYDRRAIAVHLVLYLVCSVHADPNPIIRSLGYLIHALYVAASLPARDRLVDLAYVGDDRVMISAYQVTVGLFLEVVYPVEVYVEAFRRFLPS